jgi:hypothetical protein
MEISDACPMKCPVCGNPCQWSVEHHELHPRDKHACLYNNHLWALIKKKS